MKGAVYAGRYGITIPQEMVICATDIKFAKMFADLLSLHLITFLVFLSLVYVGERRGEELVVA